MQFDSGMLTIRGNLIGKKEDKLVSIPLNTNDSLFSEIADMNISVLPRYLKEKSNEVQGTVCSWATHQRYTIHVPKIQVPVSAR